MQHRNSSNTWRQKTAFVVFVLLVVAILLVLWTIAAFGGTKRTIRSAARWHIKTAGLGDVHVLGKLAERIVPGAVADQNSSAAGGDPNIYVSIKTTKNNYKSRVAYLLLTWLQTVEPEKVRQSHHSPCGVQCILSQ